jgi:hypothetical protein
LHITSGNITEGTVSTLEPKFTTEEEILADIEDGPRYEQIEEEPPENRGGGGGMAYIQHFRNLPKYANEQQYNEWISELRQMLIMDKSEEEMQEWYDNLWKRHGPKNVDNYTCPVELVLYNADPRVHLPIYGSVKQNRFDCVDPSCPK